MKQIKTHLKYKISHDIIPCIPRITLRHWPRTDMDDIVSQRHWTRNDMDDRVSLDIVQELKLMSELAKDNGQKLTWMTVSQE